MSIGRACLAFYWLIIGTMGFVSAMDANETGALVGHAARLDSAQSSTAIRLFSCIDLGLGLWAFSGWKWRACLVAQGAVVLGYTVGLTVLAPQIWLDPFGRLAKNLPILALIWHLWRAEEKG